MKITRNIITVAAIALALPAATFAQSPGAGAGTSGYPAASGNASATDVRPSGQGATAVTTGTSSSAAPAASPGMVHPDAGDPSEHNTGNGIPVTTGTSSVSTGTSGSSR